MMSSLYKWIKNDAKVTLFLHDRMSEAKQGYLLTDDSKLSVIQLPNFTGIIDTLIDSNQLYQGRITSRKLTINRQFEDPKLFHARRVRLAKSSNTNDLSDKNISRLINERNSNYDNDKIRNCLNNIVDQPCDMNTSTKSDYKCKKGRCFQTTNKKSASITK